MSETRTTPTGVWQKLGVTYGLSRYTEDAPNQAEQLYVWHSDEPTLYPHPDGGNLAPRTYRIVAGRGYDFSRTLELTESQAVELAKLILGHADSSAYPHPSRKWDATVLRSHATTISKLLNGMADEAERTQAEPEEVPS